MAAKIWFITGASSGFGREMTELVLRNGDIAVATLRTPSVLSTLVEQYPASQLLVYQLDVTQPQAIIAAFATARKTFGRIDVVFNNAGCNLASEIEGAPEEAVRNVFEVNFWGAANVSKEAVRFFREENKPAGGRLLQVGSVSDIEGVPLIGYYSGSKAALAAFTEALDGELDPGWNIKITNVDVGYFRTEMPQKSPTMAVHPAYIESCSRASLVRQYVGDTSLIRGDPRKAVQVFYKLADLAEPPLHLPLGRDCIEVVKRKTSSLLAVTEQYASWSEDLVIVD